MAVETDELEILGGVRFGRTLGGPVAVVVRNAEWPRWQEAMAAGSGRRAARRRSPRRGRATPTWPGC